MKNLKAPEIKWFNRHDQKNDATVSNHIVFPNVFQVMTHAEHKICELIGINRPHTQDPETAL